MPAKRRDVPNPERSPCLFHEFRESRWKNATRVTILNGPPYIQLTELVTPEQILELVVDLEWRDKNHEEKNVYPSNHEKNDMRRYPPQDAPSS